MQTWIKSIKFKYLFRAATSLLANERGNGHHNLKEDNVDMMEDREEVNLLEYVDHVVIQFIIVGKDIFVCSSKIRRRKVQSLQGSMKAIYN